jgi:glycosyltransferase involved in cell wall biosynthesis
VRLLLRLDHCTIAVTYSLFVHKMGVHKLYGGGEHLSLRGKKSRRKKRGPFRIRNCETPKVSVVIPVMNERKTIKRVIRQAYRVHPQTEIIIVANGSTDGTKAWAQKMGAHVIAYDSPLGHDVGRGIGARAAKGDIILFTDGDIVIPTKDLAQLVKAVENGVDVALNKYRGPTRKKNVHPVVLAKHALNSALLRSDLRGASMTTIPHALSRRALDLIGAENLVVPPKALAVAVEKGLAVKDVHYINVGRKNPRRRKRKNGLDPLQGLIIGDHLEAIHWLIHETNIRGNKSDLTRRRDAVR